MSESTAKATRQQVRKAFGPEVVDVVSRISGSTRHLVANVTDLREGVARMEDDHDFRLRLLEAKVFTAAGWLDVQAPTTLRQRLRWLVTGR